MLFPSDGMEHSLIHYPYFYQATRYRHIIFELIHTIPRSIKIITRIKHINDYSAIIVFRLKILI